MARDQRAVAFSPADASPSPRQLAAPQEGLAELHTTGLDALHVVADAHEARRRDREPIRAAA